MGQYLEEIWEASGFEVCCLFSAALGVDTLNPVWGEMTGIYVVMPRVTAAAECGNSEWGKCNYVSFLC